MKYKILTQYIDSRSCPPLWEKAIKLNKGQIVEVLFVEAAGSGLYSTDQNNSLYRGNYLASYQKLDDKFIYMVDFELLNLIGEKIED